jgi:hypothetical protein
MKHDTYETHEEGHGRKEHRCYRVLHYTGGFRDAAEWAGLTTIGICYSRRTEGTRPARRRGTSPVVKSPVPNIQYYGKPLRNHWGIENGLHWQLDVTFGEDSNREQGRNAAAILALVRKLALPLLKQHWAKESIACKRLHAALDVGFLQAALQPSAKC